MPEHLHTVRITGTAEHPKIEFTCHGGRDAECHSYPDCRCESWVRGNHEHPFVLHDECWMQAWFDNGGTDPTAEDPITLADCGYRPGMSGPIKTSFCEEYLEWEFIAGREMEGLHTEEASR